MKCATEFLSFFAHCTLSLFIIRRDLLSHRPSGCKNRMSEMKNNRRDRKSRKSECDEDSRSASCEKRKRKQSEEDWEEEFRLAEEEAVEQRIAEIFSVNEDEERAPHIVSMRIEEIPLPTTPPRDVSMSDSGIGTLEKPSLAISNAVDLASVVPKLPEFVHSLQTPATPSRVKENSRKRHFVKYGSYEANLLKLSLKNIFDSHCHLDRMFFTPSNRNLLGLPDRFMPMRMNPESRALEFLEQKYPECFGSNFAGCISNCCDPEWWRHEDRYKWLLNEERVFLTFGCHPSKAARLELRLLEKWLDYPRVLAVGEIGLDSTYYDHGSSKEVQIKAFKEQLQLAARLHMPLVIHLRGDVVQDAHRIMFETLPLNYRQSTGIHMHCFTYSIDVARTFLDDFPKMKFGLVPHFFDGNVAKILNLEHLIIETDAPYFIPNQLKNLRSEEDNKKKYPIGLPGFAYHAAAQLALAKNVSVEQVLAKNAENLEDLYGIILPVTEDRVFKVGDSFTFSCTQEISQERELAVSKGFNVSYQVRRAFQPPINFVSTCNQSAFVEPIREQENARPLTLTEEEKGKYLKIRAKLPDVQREVIADVFKKRKAQLE